MSFRSFEEILEQCKEHNKPFWRVILEDDMQERMVTEERIHRKNARLILCNERGGQLL